MTADPVPAAGTLVLGGNTDPAMPDKVVHFVGRRRNASTPLPPSVAHLSAEGRLAAILKARRLLGFPVNDSGDVSVVCLSDVSAAELESAFLRGLNVRGPLEPWAIVIDRVRAWLTGFRPVVYADSSLFYAVQTLLRTSDQPERRALAVRTEMGQTSREDWTAEREWRFCFEEASVQPAVGVRSGISAVIVGESGWTPEGAAPDLADPMPTQRWLWDRDQGRLVHDGLLYLP